MRPSLYIDTSAAAKMVLEEPESVILENWIVESGHLLISSQLTEIELARVVLRSAPERMDRANLLLSELLQIEMSGPIRSLARSIAPLSLRSLDAIHTATALYMAREIEGVVTYDKRMAEAARANALRVFSPGAEI